MAFSTIKMLRSTMTSSLALMEQACFSVRSGCRAQMEVWMMGQSLGPSQADLNKASTNPLEQSTAEPFQSKGNALVGKSWHTRRLAAHQDPDRGPFSACKKWCRFANIIALFAMPRARHWGKVTNTVPCPARQQGACQANSNDQIPLVSDESPA